MDLNKTGQLDVKVRLEDIKMQFNKKTCTMRKKEKKYTHYVIIRFLAIIIHVII